MFLALSGCDARVDVGSGWPGHRRVVEASIVIAFIHSSVVCSHCFSALGRSRVVSIAALVPLSLVLTIRSRATKRCTIAAVIVVLRVVTREP
jgi:hypothetical protein